MTYSIRMTDSNGFRVNLQWRVANGGGNQAPNLSQIEQKDFDEIGGHEFPWTLVLDREKLEKYWPNALLPIVDSLIVAPMGPEFQISETSWAGFTSHGIFYTFTTLIL